MKRRKTQMLRDGPPASTPGHRALLWAGLVFVLVTGCGEPAPERMGGSRGARGSGVSLRIVAGSENEGLAPIIRDFARAQGAEITLDYRGSVDISLILGSESAGEYDAVWPANRIWIELGDESRRVRHEASIMRSPVVFAVRCPLARRLGWLSRPVTLDDLLGEIERGRLRFAMTSATQSNSGASFYLGALHAVAGRPEVLLREHLQDPAVRERVRRLLRAVDRSSGSSGWLKDAWVARPDRFDAMVNYEAMVIEANRELPASAEPLCAVYPSDALVIADSPLGFLDRGEPRREELFLALRDHLLSEPVQQRILALGRRTGRLGLEAGAADQAVFKPEWGLDVRRTLSPVPLPRREVIREALDLYQTALRKPSWTAYVLDYSGSMKGEPEAELEQAMRTLLDPELSRRVLLQASPEDRHMVIAFNDGIVFLAEARGNDPAVLADLLARVTALSAQGGTDMYQPLARALGELASAGNELEGFFPAVILMSDGRSQGSSEVVREAFARAGFERDVPIFTIAFGDADRRQLEELAALSAGRAFDSKLGLVQAFRNAKGYN